MARAMVNDMTVPAGQWHYFSWSWLLVAISVAFILISWQETPLAAQIAAGAGPKGSALTYSATYSPYRTHEISAEITARVLSWSVEEGQVLAAGTPLVQLDHRVLEAKLRETRARLDLLKQEEASLRRMVELKERKLARYRRLLEEGHLQPQAVEDVETDSLSAKITLLGNQKAQAEARLALAQTEDQLAKAMPVFDRPLYLSQRYVEDLETAVAGRPLARLLDISRAKVHLVMPPEDFKALETRLSQGRDIACTIMADSGDRHKVQARIEGLKMDRDNDYLYSYGMDLVFDPIPGILWGEVVRVILEVTP